MNTVEESCLVEKPRHDVNDEDFYYVCVFSMHVKKKMLLVVFEGEQVSSTVRSTKMMRDNIIV